MNDPLQNLRNKLAIAYKQANKVEALPDWLTVVIDAIMSILASCLPAPTPASLAVTLQVNSATTQWLLRRAVRKALQEECAPRSPNIWEINNAVSVIIATGKAGEVQEVQDLITMAQSPE